MMQNEAARELLAFYAETGVDAALGEIPVNRFAEPPAPSRESPRERVHSRAGQPELLGPSVAPLAAAAPDAAALEAREAAKSAATLDDLRAILGKFEGCALKATATQMVFADGTPGSRVMLVGEAPGRDEDIEGLPFVGRSGKLLDQMLKAIGLDRSKVYIANIVPWRPPGNRTPTPQETAICLPFIKRQIELADPEILICLGGPSATTLLNIREGITKSRGRWVTFDTGNREIKAMPTFHPAFLLRSPLQKRLAWRDFLAVQKALEG
ncbi:MAG: uracil-DNA glycosylase [Pseudolabrys sp.]|nr:uracil-DNA glycosylase [Pseudolabrys sp.]